MRPLVIAAMMVILMASPAMAQDISTGCVDEVTGEPGLQMASGECITPAEYDAMFSVEALSNVASQTDPTISVADIADLDTDIPASLRWLGEGLVDEPFTFVRLVNGIFII